MPRTVRRQASWCQGDSMWGLAVRTGEPQPLQEVQGRGTGGLAGCAGCAARLPRPPRTADMDMLGLQALLGHPCRRTSALQGLRGHLCSCTPALAASWRHLLRPLLQPARSQCLPDVV
jgi:hypothetical protein